MVHGDASVAIQVTTLLDETALDDRRALHGSEEGKPAELQEHERGTGQLIITIIRIVASVFEIPGRYHGGADRDLGEPRTDGDLLRGDRWKEIVTDRVLADAGVTEAASRGGGRMDVGAALRGVASGTAGVAAVDTGAVEGSDGGKEAGGLGAAFPVRVVCRGRLCFPRRTPVG